MLNEVIERERIERQTPGTEAEASERALRRRLVEAGYPHGQIEMLGAQGLTDLVLGVQREHGDHGSGGAGSSLGQAAASRLYLDRVP